jgi:hypothetical protein
MYDSAATRQLNDEFRKSMTGGRVVITRGVLALPDPGDILKRIKDFDDFNPDNDPYGEHDFGDVKHADQQIFWKIDYYDLDLEHGSPDPADTSVTTRLMTILLATEY